MKIFTQKRICRKCEEYKPLDCFYKDVKGEKGYAVTCKVCKRVKKPVKMITKHTTSKKPVTITIKPEYYENGFRDPYGGVINLKAENLLTQLSQKLNATFSITVRTDGKTYLNCHSDPQISYKALSPEELITKVLK